MTDIAYSADQDRIAWVRLASVFLPLATPSATPRCSPAGRSR